MSARGYKFYLFEFTRKRVGYRVEHSKIKFVSTRGHRIFSMFPLWFLGQFEWHHAKLTKIDNKWAQKSRRKQTKTQWEIFSSVKRQLPWIYQRFSRARSRGLTAEGPSTRDINVIGNRARETSGTQGKRLFFLTQILTFRMLY